MNLTSFIVMDVLEKALEMERAGERVIHMEVGEPDFPLPEPVAEAAARAIREGKNSYSPSYGIPELRERISDYYHRRYGVDVSPERIFITPGSSPALTTAIRIMAEERGSKIAYTDPGYPCYKNMARFLGFQEVPIEIYEEDGFNLTPEHLNDGNVLILNFPSNPTGSVFTTEELERIVEKAKSLNMGIISDEIYHGIEYQAKSPTVLQICQDAIVVNGFSKYFTATGWRLGWIIVPEDKVRLFQCIAQNLFICAPTPLQYAATECFSEEALKIYDSYVEECKRRRDYLIPALTRLGFGINYAPAGAFYIFAKVDRFTEDSFQFAMEALEKAKVAITPGKDFGNNLTHKYVRFSYANSLKNIKEGVKRLEEWLRAEGLA